eukprot:364707-Chlamydomonas_euryale.AAC.4
MAAVRVTLATRSHVNIGASRSTQEKHGRRRVASVCAWVWGGAELGEGVCGGGLTREDNRP